MGVSKHFFIDTIIQTARFKKCTLCQLRELVFQYAAKGTTHLNAPAKAALPTADAPNEMQRTSAVGHWIAAQVAERVATVPPTQKPTHTIRLGAT